MLRRKICAKQKETVVKQTWTAARIAANLFHKAVLGSSARTSWVEIRRFHPKDLHAMERVKLANEMTTAAVAFVLVSPASRAGQPPLLVLVNSVEEKSKAELWQQGFCQRLRNTPAELKRQSSNVCMYYV